MDDRILADRAAGFYSLVLPFSADADGVRHHHQESHWEVKGANEQTVLTSAELVHHLRRGNFIPAMGVCFEVDIRRFSQDTSYFIEDYPMWAKLAQSGWSLVYSPAITTLYRRAEQAYRVLIKVDLDVLRVQLEILGIRRWDFDQAMKERWFRVVCEADEYIVDQLLDICQRASASAGILLFLAKLKLSHRLRWILSNLSLKLNFWRYLKPNGRDCHFTQITDREAT